MYSAIQSDMIHKNSSIRDQAKSAAPDSLCGHNTKSKGRYPYHGKRQSIQEWSRVCQLIRSAAPDYEYDFVDIDDVRPYSELHESIAKGVRLL